MTIIRLSDIVDVVVVVISIAFAAVAAAATTSTVAGGDVLSFQFRSHRLRLVFVTKTNLASVSQLYTL